MPEWNNVQRQLAVLHLVTRQPRRRFTYADVRAEALVYQRDAPDTETVADDVTVLRRHGLVRVGTPRHPSPDSDMQAGPRGRQGWVWAPQMVTKEVDYHLTWEEHRVLSALRATYPPPPSPAPVPSDAPPKSDKFLDALRIIREAEEATTALRVSQLARRTGLTPYAVRSRVNDIVRLQELLQERWPELSRFLIVDEDIDWSEPLSDAPDNDADDDAPTASSPRCVIVDRPSHGRGDGHGRATLADVGLARFGLFPYSAAETIDRLVTIDMNSSSVTDDGDLFHLQEARYKLLRWLGVIAPARAARFQP